MTQPGRTESSSHLYRCPRCGMVREDATGAPWCRHAALDLPADRMRPLTRLHPLYGRSSTDAGYEWLAGKHVTPAMIRRTLVELAEGQL